MTRLPQKRQRLRSGIERAPKREWSRHRIFLRSHHCVVPHCFDGPIEVSHIRTAANSGTALKPHDCFAVPMCEAHHRCYHQYGHRTFEKATGVNLKALAAAFVKASPDKAMRDSLKLVDAETLA